MIPAPIAFVAHFAAVLYLEKFNSKSNAQLALLLVIPLALLITSNYFAFSKGVIEHDLKFLQKQESAQRVSQHPANSTMATLAAFHAESDEPPRLMHSDGRMPCTYLLPMQMHIGWLAGYFYGQGFVAKALNKFELRGSEHRKHFRPTILLIFPILLGLSGLPEAVPRRDLAGDVPDELLIQIIRWLASNKKPLLARELTKEIPNPADITKPDILKAIAWSYYYTQQFD